MVIDRKLLSLIIVAAAMGPRCLLAAGTGETRLPDFTFSAFGTLGVTHSDNDQSDFVSRDFKANGAGFTHAWSPAVDSRLGGQVQALFTPHLSAVIQVTSEERYDGTYKPEFEWANIKYQFSPDLSLRVGRTVIPGFLLSDSRKIGYAMPQVRPYVEVYGLLPLTSSDGIDGSYRMRIGNFTNTLTGVYGQTNARPTFGGEVEVRRQFVISDQLEFGAATLHFSYLRSHLTFTGINDFFDIFRQFGPRGVEIADQYGSHDKPLWFVSVGGQYDPGKWFVTAEWASTKFHSIFEQNTAWYASGGYRIGMFTPYLTYAQVTAIGNSSDPGLDASTFPPEMSGTIAGLNVALNSWFTNRQAQSTISTGVRWDFARNVDLKLQYDHINLGAGSPGFFANLQPGFVRGSNVNLFSITIDFVL